MQPIVAAFLLSIASVSWAAQSPDQGQVTKGGKKTAATEKLGTEKAPLFVQALPPLKNEEERKREEADRQQKADLETGTYRVNRLQLAFNALLFFATVVMGFVTYRAANAAKKSATAASDTVTTMKDTAIRQLRAYISAESHAPKDVDGNRMGEKYGLLIRNRGQTPAYKVRSWMQYAIREFPLNEPLASHTSSGSVSILAPGEEQMLIADWPAIPVVDVAAVAVGKKAAYIFGEILYEDAFGQERYTRFRLFQSGQGVGHQRLALYPEGNEAT